jgi:hypothetical protein
VHRRGADDEVDDRETPPCVFAPLDLEFRFTLDVAAARHNAKCARYYALGASSVQRRQTSLWSEAPVGDPSALAEDGLAQEWAPAERVWCNPPFSDLPSWVAKAHAAPCTVVMLLPANRTEQPWWQSFVEPYRDQPGGCVATRFLGGRRTFLYAGEDIVNSTNKSPPFGIVIVVWDRRAP